LSQKTRERIPPPPKGNFSKMKSSVKANQNDTNRDMKNEVRAKDKNEKKAVVRQDNGINSSIESNLESRFSMKLNCI